MCGALSSHSGPSESSAMEWLPASCRLVGGDIYISGTVCPCVSLKKKKTHNNNRKAMMIKTKIQVACRCVCVCLPGCKWRSLSLCAVMWLSEKTKQKNKNKTWPRYRTASRSGGKTRWCFPFYYTIVLTWVSLFLSNFLIEIGLDFSSILFHY